VSSTEIERIEELFEINTVAGVGVDMLKDQYCSRLSWLSRDLKKALSSHNSLCCRTNPKSCRV